jgi:hypothetical protein
MNYRTISVENGKCSACNCPMTPTMEQCPDCKGIVVDPAGGADDHEFQTLLTAINNTTVLSGLTITPHLETICPACSEFVFPGETRCSHCGHIVVLS